MKYTIFLKVYINEASQKFVSNSNRKVRDRTEIIIHILTMQVFRMNKYTNWLISRTLFAKHNQFIQHMIGKIKKNHVHIVFEF